MELIEVFKQRMREKGLTQKDLEEATGITQANLSRYLSGKQKPRSNDIIKKIAKALDINDLVENDQTTVIVHSNATSEPQDIYWKDDRLSALSSDRIHGNSKLLSVVHQEIESIEARLKGITVFRNLDRNEIPTFISWLEAMHKHTESVLELIKELGALAKS